MNASFWGDVIPIGETGAVIDVPPVIAVEVTNVALPAGAVPLPQGVAVIVTLDGQTIGTLTSKRPHCAVSATVGPGDKKVLRLKIVGGQAKGVKEVHATGSVMPIPGMDDDGEFTDMTSDDVSDDDDEEEEEEIETSKIEELPSSEDDGGDAEVASAESLVVHGVKYYRQKGSNSIYTHSKDAAAYIGDYDEKHKSIIVRGAPPGMKKATPPPPPKGGKRNRNDDDEVI